MSVHFARLICSARCVISGSLFLLSSLPAMALEVTIRGVEDEDLLETLEGASLAIEVSNREDPASTQEIISSAQADYRRILAVLYDNGFFGPTISVTVDGQEASKLEVVTPPDSIGQIVISVSTGPQFLFGDVGVSPMSPSTQLPKGFKLGEPASLSAIQGAARAGIAGWREDGHAKAKVAGQNITARHTSNELDASVQIDPGPEVTFGPLIIEGNVNVRTERIMEIADLPEGETFSQSELDDMADRLRRTGAFRSVAISEPQEVGPDNVMPINARIAEEKPRRLGFGGDLGNTEGLSLRGFWIHRNLFGGAERLALDAEVSGIGGDTGGIDYVLGARLERPATINSETKLFVLGALERLDRRSYTSDQASFIAGFEYTPDDRRKYSIGAGLTYADALDATGPKKYLLLPVPAFAELDYRDIKLDPRRGYYLGAGLTPFLALSGSDNGAQTLLDVRKFLSFGHEKLATLALRGQFGSLAGPSIADAPVDYLFYSGGSNTVRGHKFESLGVDLGNGVQVGGRSFVGFSTEARVRTSGALGFVAFFDAGYVGAESFFDGTGRWHSGAGVGVRYATGIGPIRFDFAVPTSGDDNGSSYQFYIGIGQAF